MRLLILIAINLHFCKTSRKYELSSDESIENLLYYKDCKYRAEETTTQAPTPQKLVGPPPSRSQNDCPFPKMCCSMSCGNECGGTQQQSVIGRQMEPLRNMQQSIQPIESQPRQPLLQMQPQVVPRERKKKMKPTKIQFPMGGRRDFGFTKEKIKSLISQDGDIRKILKDLVRVTMQKVDLLDLINARNSNFKKIPDESVNSVDEDDHLE